MKLGIITHPNVVLDEEILKVVDKFKNIKTCVLLVRQINHHDIIKLVLNKSILYISCDYWHYNDRADELANEDFVKYSDKIIVFGEDDINIKEVISFAKRYNKPVERFKV